MKMKGNCNYQMKLLSRFLLPLLACSLWAQDANNVTDKGAVEVPRVTVSEVESLKARIAWLEQKLAITEAKMAALMQFSSANEQLTGLAAKEPKALAPKPEEKA